MVNIKKLKDLTAEEIKKCGWIEKVAYRGNTTWMQYDEEHGFDRLKRRYPENYDLIYMAMGEKWFAMYFEAENRIILMDIAKMDIGEDQQKASKEIKDFTKEIVDKRKVIFAVTSEETSYFSFVKSAAEGEIEIFKDIPTPQNNKLRDIIFIKSSGEKDLTSQVEEYQEKYNKMQENKSAHKENRKRELEEYIKGIKKELEVSKFMIDR